MTHHDRKGRFRSPAQQQLDEIEISMSRQAKLSETRRWLFQTAEKIKRQLE